MQLPSGSYDAYVHMFFANHYAQHWFDPWNTQWFAGFSQTTYPPLAHQLIALFSFVMGLQLAYMFVQLIAVLLLTVGIYRFAGLWVDETAASYAALGSVFLGSLAMLVYQSGQLNTTLGAAITVNAIPYFYRWLREARVGDLVKAFLITVSAAAVHHLTLITIVMFSFPVIWLAIVDREDQAQGTEASVGGILTRAVVFGILHRRRNRRCPASLLDRVLQKSSHADADSAPQPKQLFARSPQWIEFLGYPVRRDDPGDSLHLLERIA